MRKKVAVNVGFWLLVSIMAVSIAVVLYAWPYMPNKPLQSQQQGYSGVLQLWNVETFEGGSGSRSSWLTSVAGRFEQNNKGLFVHVTNLTVDQLQQKLDEGQSYDLISFSRGVGCLLENLSEISLPVGDLLQGMVIAGQSGGKQYAIPYYAGAYCLFARSSQLSQEAMPSQVLSTTYSRIIGKNKVDLQPLLCGFTPYNSPLSALAMSGARGSVNLEQYSQYQAYELFLSNKTAVTLLGTQRDAYRLGKRVEMERIEQLSFCCLGNYTDLVQFVGINKNSADKMQACEQFVQFLVSKTTQHRLVDINMLSVRQDVKLYSDEWYKQCQDKLSSCYVPNVFSTVEEIHEGRKAAINTMEM